ncbi:MAG: nitronate monooxygenase family protein [Limnochordia bacterium]|nr:nitronate monooxygenase family protein [Limnochordia bacterium]MDD2629793.1 nitronate monooxygenase family protein [Limnochordia bacterium]MDD4517814.1 nitronate monooxygenase family protein [Limnochordia bacterium]
MQIPKLKIGDLVAKLPIIQGGMGVGISLSGLAAAVGNAGGVGVISGVEIGFDLPSYLTDKVTANRQALADHIQRARELCPKGILGVNIMTALSDFAEMVKEAVKEKIDIIFAGAGLPLDLPELVKDSETKIVPIVSSAKAANVICKYWDRKSDYCPDAIVVEGPKAGGHLGFSEQELQNDATQSLPKLVQDVLEIIKPFEQKYGREIPVIAAGGIFTGGDIGNYLSMGVSGVQMGTRFVGTHECDASPGFKQQYLNAKKEDIVLIKSPVGMPGRAINNDFLEKVSHGTQIRTRCQYHCLKHCRPQTARYCIAEALIHAQRGEMDGGFAFAGTNAYRVDKLVSVQDLMDELTDELTAHQGKIHQDSAS